MKNKIKILLLMILVVTVMLGGCNSAKQSKNLVDGDENKEDVMEDRIIKVGGTETSQYVFDAINEEYEKLGYKAEFVLFDSNVLPITAANDGSIDISFGQHIKFMEQFNKENKGNLVMMEPYGYYTGIGLYSEKHDSIEEFPEGAKISIMNDVMNMNRGLEILDDIGLIKLSDKNKGHYTIIDIVDNPKKIEIIEMEQAQTVRSLDEMDGAIVFFTHMHNAGKDPSKYLARDKNADKYPMSPIVKEKNKNKQWAIDFANCLKIDSVKEKIDKEFPGVFIHYEK